MKALVLLFWQMLRFKRNPEDAPYSAPLLLVIIAINFVLAATAQAVGRQPVGKGGDLGRAYRRGRWLPGRIFHG